MLEGLCLVFEFYFILFFWFNKYNLYFPKTKSLCHSDIGKLRLIFATSDTVEEKRDGLRIKKNKTRLNLFCIETYG